MDIYELSIDDLDKSKLFFPILGQEELLLELAENKITNGISVKNSWDDFVFLKKEPQIDADFYDIQDSGLVILSPKAYKLISPLLDNSVETLKLKTFDEKESIYDEIDEDFGTWLGTQKIVLDKSVLGAIPLNQRLGFRLREAPGYRLYHKSVIDVIESFKPTGVYYVNIEDYEF